MPNKQLEKIAASLVPGGRLLHYWQLTGGVSALTTALEIGLPQGQVQRLVVRQHGEADLRRNPQIAVTEYRLLELLHGLGLPVPRPYAVISADQCLDFPALALEYVQGKTELAPVDALPLAQQMADYLVQVHAVDSTELDFLPRQEEQIVCNQPALLHGDYWPGNILWQNDQSLAAIIDWEDACLGDPLSDLANSRLELAIAYGPAAMHVFTERYRAASQRLSYVALPYADLWAARRLERKLPSWGLEPQAEQAMLATVQSFKEQAQQRLS